MGYLTMCALSARARRCGSCVLPSPCPRGDLSTWCVERAIAAATLQGVPGARPGDCVVGLLCMVMQPPEPVGLEFRIRSLNRGLGHHGVAPEF